MDSSVSLHRFCDANKTHLTLQLCGVLVVKDPLLLIGKCRPCRGGSEFRL